MELSIIIICFILIILVGYLNYLDIKIKEEMYLNKKNKKKLDELRMKMEWLMDNANK